jgi:hypothetical protein
MPKRQPIILPSVEYLHECFICIRLTGELRWKIRPREHFATLHGYLTFNAQHGGKPAGCVDKKGYMQVRFGNVGYKTHRIIWKMVTGKEPPESIDHRDGDQLNNRWKNLRKANPQEQAMNRGVPSNNTSGVKGVYRGSNGNPNKWRIHIDGHRTTFDTLEEAAEARDRIARELHGDFYRE